MQPSATIFRDNYRNAHNIDYVKSRIGLRSSSPSTVHLSRGGRNQAVRLLRDLDRRSDEGFIYRGVRGSLSKLLLDPN